MVDKEELPHDVHRLCHQLPGAQINMLKLLLDVYPEGGEWPFFSWCSRSAEASRGQPLHHLLGVLSKLAVKAPRRRADR